MPDHANIEYQQKLLSMYRSILAEYFRQRDLWDEKKAPILLGLARFFRHSSWDRADIPAFLSTEISSIRYDIVRVKGRLRGWKVAVAEHPNDQDPDDDLAGDIAHYRELLQIYRRRLPLHLTQQEQFGENLAPPMVFHQIWDARSEIQRIKAILRGWDIVVEDLPEEEETV